MQIKSIFFIVGVASDKFSSLAMEPKKKLVVNQFMQHKL